MPTPTRTTSARHTTHCTGARHAPSAHTHTQQGCHLWPQSEAPPLQQQMLTQVPPVAPGAVCAAGVSPSCSMLLALAVLTKVLPVAGCRGRVHVTHTAGAR